MSIIKNLLNNLGFYTVGDLTAAREEGAAMGKRSRDTSHIEAYETGMRDGVASVERHYLEHEIVRLQPQVYEQFRKLVTAGNSTLTGTTTELQAGHIIGVNHALTILRDGFVVEAVTAAKPV